MDDGMVAPTRHKLDASTYYRIVEAGIFGKHDHVELIDGDIIDMAPIGLGHEALVSGLTEALVVASTGRVTIWPQNSIALGSFSAPQPDLAVLRRRADFYATGKRPGPADVLLLIEVSDNSLRYDLDVKLPLYARAGIPELWIVDLKRRAVDAYRDPAGDAYATMTTHQAGDRVTLAAAPEIVVALDVVFG